MLDICFLIVLICIGLCMIGSMINKDIFEKILFLNTGTSLITLLICFLGSFKFNNSYLDIALIYFLLSVVATSAYLKYFIHQKQKKY